MADESRWYLVDSVRKVANKCCTVRRANVGVALIEARVQMEQHADPSELKMKQILATPAAQC